jgi:hypothetical protein
MNGAAADVSLMSAAAFGDNTAHAFGVGLQMFWRRRAALMFRHWRNHFFFGGGFKIEFSAFGGKPPLFSNRRRLSAAGSGGGPENPRIKIG